MRSTAASYIMLSIIFFLCVAVSGGTNSSKTIENESEILVHDSGIFLRAGETWSFHQGYSITLRDVHDDYAWLDLSHGNVSVKDTIVSSGSVFIYNRSINNESMTIFYIVIEGIYVNPSGYLVTLSPVIQYVDPTLPASAPVFLNATPVPTDTTIVDSPPSAPSYILAASALILLILIFYIMKKI
ncbi:MAG: hypothetical protein AEth_00802 [Candidatus Argoarchaeum ethanivorans]|uniref:S-layer family duplication domain-containing protein n=1 Tax=Candidatus Argoarchaeum ethanivorans TaxID=2608793 RepID=A0A8B3S1G8_9EURY|nr:MAG: hypothetical protein AEth_00802 [Candidatus Argoarchaeum ethanivorans]